MAALNDGDAMQIDEATFDFKSLPGELRLCCCEFLDAGSLARLETCARESLIDSKRAWKQLVAGSSRGALINCSDKHLAVVTAGVRALFPRSMDVPDEPLPPRPRYEVGLPLHVGRVLARRDRLPDRRV